jgi:small subunit ribosomal protein S16
MGNKGRPFYRMVVAKSEAKRGGAFVESLGYYDPVKRPKVIHINEERALHWLMLGAQPTETTAYLLKKVGVLDRFFEVRPKAKKKFWYLDRTTGLMAVKSAIPVAAVEGTEPDLPSQDEEIELRSGEVSEEAIEIAQTEAAAAKAVVEEVAEEVVAKDTDQSTEQSTNA